MKNRLAKGGLALSYYKQEQEVLVLFLSFSVSFFVSAVEVDSCWSYNELTASWKFAGVTRLSGPREYKKRRMVVRC